MKIEITEDKLLSKVQTDFNQLFPGLKLVFFRGHTNPETAVHVLREDSTIGDVTYGMQEGSIQLTENMTASELEEIFNERFGLHVQILSRLDYPKMY